MAQKRSTTKSAKAILRAVGVGDLERLESRQMLSVAHAAGKNAESVRPSAVRSAKPFAVTNGLVYAPAGLSAAGAAGEVALTWIGTGTEFLTAIERKLTSQGNTAFVQIGWVPGGTTAYSDKSALAGISYTYRARSSNGAVFSPYSIEATSAISAGSIASTNAPGAPSNFWSNGTAGQVDLFWINTGTGNIIAIERRLASQGDNAFVQIGFVSATATAFSDKSVAAGQQYVYRARVNDGANSSAYSNLITGAVGIIGSIPTGSGSNSNAANASNTPNTPSNLSAQGDGTQINLNWTGNGGNESIFAIERKSAGQGENAFIQIGFVGVGKPAFVDKSPAAGLQYTYRVRSTNGGVFSGYSNESTAAISTGYTQQSSALSVSSNGRYLINADGSAFIWVGDTGWRLLSNLSRQDADLYFKTRAEQGFTVIMSHLVDEFRSPNSYGERPFINDDPAKPNEAYFSRMDQLVSDANALGLTMAIVAAWANSVNGPKGIFFDAASAAAFGQYIGQRYKGQRVVWVLGGDGKVTTNNGVWDAMADGINAGSGGANLISYHPVGGYSSSQGYFNDSRISFNMIQSGHTIDSNNYDMVTADYGSWPIKPTIDIESNYEQICSGLVDGNVQVTDYDVRKKSYWSLFAGGFGVMYGNMNVYQFWNSSKRADFPRTPAQDWHQALYSPGAIEMKYVKKLIQSRPVLSRVPDQSVMIFSTGVGGDFSQATRDSNGTYAMVYTASGKPIWANMSKISSGNTVRASWYDPRSGLYTAIGTYPNTGYVQFTPPSLGYGNDWVLVLDDASKGYPVN